MFRLFKQYWFPILLKRFFPAFPQLRHISQLILNKPKKKTIFITHLPVVNKLGEYLDANSLQKLNNEKQKHIVVPKCVPNPNYIKFSNLAVIKNWHALDNLWLRLIFFFQKNTFRCCSINMEIPLVKLMLFYISIKQHRIPCNSDNYLLSIIDSCFA